MHKDAPATPANELDDGIIATAARRKTCVLILLLGATLGILVGILNLLSMHNQWALQDDFFDIVDAPISSLMSGPLVNLGPGYGLGWIIYSLKLAFILICYWAAIGLFLASLICFVCSGLRRDIARDKICRYILFFGTCGGISVGSFSFLAASNGWGNLENFFDCLNQPVHSVIDALQDKYNILDFLPSDPRAEFIFRNTVDVVYWTVIGLLVVLLLCVVRILKKRKAARETQVVRGLILLCLSGASGQASIHGPRER
jgi:hypothetical protein